MVSVNRALYGRQANSSTLEFIFTVKALKNLEEFACIFHVESDPIILKFVGGNAIFSGG